MEGAKEEKGEGKWFTSCFLIILLIAVPRSSTPVLLLFITVAIGSRKTDGSVRNLSSFSSNIHIPRNGHFLGARTVNFF